MDKKAKKRATVFLAIILVTIVIFILVNKEENNKKENAIFNINWEEPDTYYYKEEKDKLIFTLNRDEKGAMTKEIWTFSLDKEEKVSDLEVESIYKDAIIAKVNANMWKTLGYNILEDDTNIIKYKFAETKLNTYIGKRVEEIKVILSEECLNETTKELK